MRRATLSLSAFLLTSIALVQADPDPAGTHHHADVIIYGATPAGIAAAISAGSSGLEVLLVEPTDRIGGLVTNGLSHTDFRTFEGITGIFLELNQRVGKHYIDEYGPDSPQAKGNFRGTQAEPKVNLQVFSEMLADAPTVSLLTGHRIQSVAWNPEGKRIASIDCVGPDDQPAVCVGEMFIDATYEGDLMAAAGVPWTVGREGRDRYGESLAPEKPDAQLQAYNFRLIMTRDPGNRVMPVAPPGYEREYFLPVVPLLEQGKFKSVVCESTGGLIKAHLPELPNRKHDINDVSRGLVRLSLPGLNSKWPDGTPADRRLIFAEHLRHNTGLIYFLQNDPAVPAKFQSEIRQWGWCRDEFIDTGHLPAQLYVREARRMIGHRVFTEHDTEYAEGDARSVFQPDSIAMGDYGNNCHGTAHEGPRFGGKHTGEFYKKVAPYQIPLGTILPKVVENLIVPVANSSSHVGYCALRLEPIWSALGEAAGITAHHAIEDNTPVQKVNPRRVQLSLHARGAATLYTSDVLPGHPDFAALQWWGSLGGLHGLAPTPEEPGQRGENIHGQYFKAYPGHAAELGNPLDDETRKRWIALAKENGISVDTLTETPTRGDFIRRVHGRLSH